MKKILCIGMLLLLILTGCVNEEVKSIETTVEQEVEEAVETAETVKTVKNEVDTEVNEVVECVFRVTAYCSCEKCCGKWAKNRPTDEFGNEIVYGALGTPLTSHYSAASPMAFGTKVDLGELGIVEVQDRTSDRIVEEYGEYVLDIYINDHDEALAFGVQYLRGVLVD